MRTLATHQCGLDSNSGVNGHNYVGWVCCWFSLLLRGVFRVLQFFPSSQKSTLPNSNSVRKARTPLKEFYDLLSVSRVNKLQHLTSQRTPVCRLCPGKEEVVALSFAEKWSKLAQVGFSSIPLYWEGKSLRHVATVAKFLDDNKPLKSLKSLFALFQTSPILSNFI